jgi:hypothetical protein
MVSIYDAQVPSQRWALPSDSDWDRYGDEFERWVNDNYNEDTQTIFGQAMTYDEAMASEGLFESFVQDWEDALAEARAERMADNGDW